MTTGKALIESLEVRQLLAFSALINFQPQGAPTPSGYKADTGAVFGNRGGGLSYGWNAANNNAIDRNSSLSPDQRYDTFAQMQKNGNFSWEIAVPAGSYNVKLFAGDPLSNDAFYHVFAETRQMINGAPSNAQRWIGANFVVDVTDGRLTITNGPNAVNNKINFIEVTKAGPATPSNLTAQTLSSTQIKLNWQDNSINEDGFVIERAINPTQTYQTIATVGANVTTFTNSTLTPSTEYRYRVRSFNDVSSYWFYTNVATAMTQAVASTPVAPSNLVATAGDYVTTLTWQDNSSTEDKFVLQHLSYNNWNTVKEIPANQTTTYAYLDSATDNHFRVIARSNTSGDSPASNLATVTTRPEPPVYPFAQALSSSVIEISWDSIDSCQFHVEKLVGGQWVRIASDLLSLNYRDTGLPAGTAQSYRVLAAAVNSAGDSAPSDVVTATTFAVNAPKETAAASVFRIGSQDSNDTSVDVGSLIDRSLDEMISSS